MNLLFVHQGYPGQYIHMIRALAKQKQHQIVGLGIEEANEALPENTHYFRYCISRENQAGLHPWAQDIETKVIRADSCARGAFELKQKGFIPDIICGHPGWGEMLFLKEIWPKTPILAYQEFFYNPYGFDYDFDKELQPSPTWEDRAKIRMKTANQLLNLEICDWGVTPTEFQLCSYPESWRHKISVIHDGIDTNIASPSKKKTTVVVNEKVTLAPEDTIITFVNRRLEPYRGCHTMIRAIPYIQDKYPHAKIVIIGETNGVSYGAVCPNGEWKERFLDEIDGQYNPEQVSFIGSISHDMFISILQLSNAHVYLTYPFVLSWSLLEAMSIECPIVASSTIPVQEVLIHENNGLLVDFFSPRELSNAIDRLLSDTELAAELGKSARKTVLNKFELTHCVKNQLNLIDLVASKCIP